MVRLNRGLARQIVASLSVAGAAVVIWARVVKALVLAQRRLVVQDSLICSGTGKLV